MYDRAGFIQTLRSRLGADHSDGPSDALRYVAYVRKSTDKAEMQVRSLGDQIAECEKLAEDQDLNLVKIIEESLSAKESDQRPKFREMLDAIQRGTYDGIIAWHPDRLARNMKEAGELIDLLDKGIIKDFRFVSFSFQNNASGKTMLGITFVMSKQYSDQLSDNVKRSIRRGLTEGKFMRGAKHGYYKDARQLLRPDGENFELIKTAFEMRLQNKSLADIAKFLSSEGYPRKTKHRRADRNVTVAFISEMVRDPFYAGILVYGDDIVDLNEIYDFEPAVSIEDFQRITNIDSISKQARLTQAIKPRGKIQADFLRGMIICSSCGRPMSAGLTTKKLPNEVRRYFFYRCDRVGCVRKGKSIRAKVILDFVLDFVKKHPLTDPDTYEAYIKEKKRLIELGFEKQKKRLYSLNARKAAAFRKIEGTKAILLDERDPEVVRMLKTDLKDFAVELREYKDEIDSIESKKSLQVESLASYEEFVELFGKLAKVIEKAKHLRDRDAAIRKMFMNFTTDGKKILNFELNSPFSELSAIKKNQHDADSFLVTPGGIEPPFSG